ncbi:hypothetical protein [Azospirillum agricola]|uniref:hypothetical protein n=1 Tax=Azospirillum agricola TaxID=1720247 RepID=UPI000A0F061A|nr:hypothetical protein [Azospirillum agricola]SMH47037.1 hypothetical protein SAMN02982994_2522 [Azospirillum lipoferum]
MNRRPTRALLAAAALLPVLLAASGCAQLGSTSSAAILERVADGEYDFGIRYPSKRARYVMIVEDDGESFTLANRPVLGGTGDGAASDGAAPAAPQRNDRVLAPCADAAGNWYRHTPAGYVCAGESAPGAGG